MVCIIQFPEAFDVLNCALKFFDCDVVSCASVNWIPRFPKPYVDSSSVPIYFCHPLDLFLSFLNVPLVDANEVDPKPKGFKATITLTDTFQCPQ